MTTQSFRLKLARVNSLKLRNELRLPTSVQAEAFLTASLSRNILTLGTDYEILDPAAFTDPTTTIIAVYDQATQSWKQTTLSALISGTISIEQHITDPGPVDILPNTGLVRVDQAVGAAITLNMPLSNVKTCPVKIIDWKGDAGTNNITISLAGSDKFQGNLTSWILGADGASVVLDPIAGAGYGI